MNGRRLRLVGDGIPVDERVVDDLVGNGLIDDALHDLDDRALLGQTVFRVAVVGLDLVPQVPVLEESHLLGEEAPSSGVDEVMHPDVVGGDVLVRLGAEPRGSQADVGRDALRERVGEFRLRPLPASPVISFLQTLVERGQWEVEEDGEGNLVREEVFIDVGAGAVSGQRLVEGLDRSEIEVRLAAQIAANLGYVAVDGLQHELHAVEERVERRLIAGEVRPYEVFEGH